MAMAKSGYTLQVIKAGQQGHVEMRWGHLAEVDTRAAAAAVAAAATMAVAAITAAAAKPA